MCSGRGAPGKSTISSGNNGSKGTDYFTTIIFKIAGLQVNWRSIQYMNKTSDIFASLTYQRLQTTKLA